MHEHGPGAGVVRAIEGLISAGSLTGLTEEELLACLVQGRDPRAFAMIVDLHGPMVLAVCRQLLSDPNDIDDAVQATFLVLIRKAGLIRRPGSLGPWLYGVASRTAVRLRRSLRPLRLVTEPVHEQPPCPVDQAEQFDALHQEISRLPQKYRQPIVLCYFEGLTHDAAAARLAWPVGTVRGRLARARDRLRKQLSTRGVCLSAGLLDAMEHAGLRGRSLTSAKTHSIVKLLEHCASSRVVSLTQGVLAAMLTEKLKWIVVGVTAPSIFLIAAGTALIAGSGHGPAGKDPGPTVQAGKGAKPKTVETKALNTQKAEEELLAKVNRLESDRVEAEILEMETHALQVSLQRLISQSVSFDRPSPILAGDAKQQKQVEVFRESVHMRIDEIRKSYRNKRMILALLKRKIARESKEMGSAESETSNLSEMSQRLRTLETKVDQILEAVVKSPR